MRIRVGVRLGDGGNKRLGYTIRAHGNALEHGLVLSVGLVLAEVAGMPAQWVVGLGCVILAKTERPDLAGANVVVIGRSILVGKPAALLFLAENCTTTIAHSRTADLAALCRTADILVPAIGRPEMVRGDWIKPGAIVIDVGMNRIPSPRKKNPQATKLVGDVAFAEAAEIASAIGADAIGRSGGSRHIYGQHVDRFGRRNGTGWRPTFLHYTGERQCRCTLQEIASRGRLCVHQPGRRAMKSISTSASRARPVTPTQVRAGNFPGGKWAA